MIDLANRLSTIKPSPTLAVASRAKALKAEGRDIIDLGVGEPDFDTPDTIKAAAIAAIQAGHTKYTAVDGLPACRQAIAEKLKRDNQFDYAIDEILVSCGAKHSLYNLFQALLNPGDEVIIPAPYWVSYPDMVALAEGKPVIARCDAGQRFCLGSRQLEGLITERTRALVLNSPSNPTGNAYSHDQLSKLADVLRQHKHIVIVTDDIYEHIYWGKEPFANLLNIAPDLKDRTVVINGVSKAYAMTGWRIGYAAGPAELIAGMRKLQSQSTSNPCSIAQYASIEALKSTPESHMVEAFKERHAYIVEALNTLPGVHCLPAQGAFYAFPSFAEAFKTLNIGSDVDFCQQVLEETGVAMVPGSAFGLPGHVRFSYATSMDNLQEAMRRLATVLNR